MRNFILFIIYFLILSSCSRVDNSNNKELKNSEEFAYPNINILKSLNSNSSLFLKELILEGKYIKCLGRNNGETWKVSSIIENNRKINNRLIFKKDDKGCELHFTKISVKNLSDIEYIYSPDRNKDTILKNIYFNYNLELKNSNKFVYSNLRLSEDKSTIEIFFMKSKSYIGLNKKIENIKVEIKAEAQDNLDQINMNYGESILKRYKFTNTGTSSVFVQGFSNDLVFNNSCKDLLSPTQICYADFLLTARDISNKNFKINANYKYNNELAKIKSANKNVEVRSSFNNNSNILEDKYIYRLYHYGNTIFVANFSQNQKGLYYSNTGPNSNFNKVSGLPSDLEIRGMAKSGNKVYVIAYNNNSNDERGGLYYAELNENHYDFKIVNKMKKYIDFHGISSNGDLLYIVTNQNGVFYFENGNHESIKEVIIQDKNSKEIFKKFGDVFVIDNEIFVIKDKNIYYANLINKESFEIFNISINDSKEDIFIKHISLVKDKILIGTNKGLFYTNKILNELSSNYLRNEFIPLEIIYENERLNFNNNEIYDLKTYTDSIYVVTICENKICKLKNGIYQVNNIKNNETKKIFSNKNILDKFIGVTINNGDIYGAKTSGIDYYKFNIPRKIENKIQDNSLIKPFFIKEDRLFLLDKGAENSLYYSDLFGKSKFKKINMMPNLKEIYQMSAYESNIYAIVKNSNDKGVWFAENSELLNSESLNFKQINSFSNFDIKSVIEANNFIFFITESYILFSKLENPYKLNYLTISDESDFSFGFNENIIDLYFDNKTLYLLTNKNIYKSSLSNDNNDALLKELEFIKIKTNLPQNLNSFFVKNKSIYLATKNGIWFSENLFNGNFQQLNLFNNENILSLKLLGNLFYVMKNDGLYLINIYDYISNFLELKLNHSSAINSKEVKQVFVNKNKILAIQNDQLMSSSDNGKNFNNIILSKNNIKSNFIFPFGDSLYLATNKGLFVSNNNDNIFDINLDNRFYNYITNYKNKLLLSSNDGVYELLNNGSIHKVNSLKTNKIYSFNDNIYFITNKGKLLKSDDGINYNEIYKEIIKEEKILSLFFDNENLYVGTDNGLFIFYNNDKYFKKYLISDINLNINHINSIQKFGSMLYLATNSGIAISEDGGESFKVLGEEGGLGAEKINDIYLNFSNSQSVSLSFYFATENGLFVSNL